MIERINTNEFAFSCDICCKEIGAHNEHKQAYFDTFCKAVMYKKEKGWRSIRINGERSDVCPRMPKQQQG